LFLKTDGAGNLSFSSDLPTTSFTGATVETSIADSDLVLIYDDSATAVRKMTKANLVAGIGGSNTPAFLAYKSGGTQSLASSTFTKVTFNTELFDTNNNFASSAFTPTTAGKYLVLATMSAQGNITTSGWIVYITLNGSAIARTNQYHSGGQPEAHVSTIVEMNGTTDYLEVYAYQTSGSAVPIYDAREHTYFGAFKLL
jgi:hypothetical protein